MAVAEVIAVIKDVVEIVKALVEISEKVNNFFENPDEENRRRYEEQMAKLVEIEHLIVDKSAAILKAIDALKESQFKSELSARLGEINAAEDALVDFLETGDPADARAAKQLSSLAINTLVSYAHTGAFPAESILVVLGQSLLSRLMILATTEPGFCASSEVKAIEQSVALFESVANKLTSEIQAANFVKTTVYTYMDDLPVEARGQVVVTVTNVSYENVTRSVRYFQSIESRRPNQYYKNQVIQFQAEAEALRPQGIVEDLASAAVPNLLRIADQAKRAIQVCRGRRMERMLGRKLSHVQRGRYRSLLSNLDAVQADFEFIRTLPSAWQARTATDDASANKLAVVALGREVTAPELAAIAAFRKAFGMQPVTLALLSQAHQPEPSESGGSEAATGAPGLTPART